MWKSSGESIDHLFLHCILATELWRMILQMFGMEWVMWRSVKDMLGSWRGQNTDTYLALGSTVFDVVCLEGTKCTLFWRL
jgi:hypothetical protein